MEMNGQFMIRTDDMELAGLLVQSLTSYLNITDLQVVCDFPHEIESLNDILNKVLIKKLSKKNFNFYS